MNHLDQYKAAKAVTQLSQLEQFRQGLQAVRGQNQPKGLPTMGANTSTTDADEPLEYNPANVWGNVVTGTGAGPIMPGAEPRGETD